MKYENFSRKCKMNICIIVLEYFALVLALGFYWHQ